MSKNEVPRVAARNRRVDIVSAIMSIWQSFEAHICDPLNVETHEINLVKQTINSVYLYSF